MKLLAYIRYWHIDPNDGFILSSKDLSVDGMFGIDENSIAENGMSSRSETCNVLFTKYLVAQ